MNLHSKQLVLGIDGGGSATRAALAVVAESFEFHIVGRGMAGASNFNSCGWEAATEQVQRAIQSAFESAGTEAHQVAAICLGMSGAGRTVEQQAWLRWAEESHIAEQARVVTDAETVLAAGTPEGAGVALIAGTGSLAFGKNAAGENARAGGWGYLLGDEGSGYQIALAAMQGMARAVDGRGPETRLQAAFQDALDLNDPRELIGYLYHTDRERSDIAGLSRLVFTAAEQGDVVACEVLRQAIQDLTELVSAVVTRLHFSRGDYALALTGGILLHQRDFRVSLLERLRELKLEPVSIECVDDASLGAVRLGINGLKHA
ncbi:MAG: N-acetylglucosamine kinase [Gimesia sp.]|uniref:N-acetylglucosamine kinase n=1 Tax=Gimesia maris TaxID=122 RepID=A0A3D3R0B3_9PLAN|nr:N-acetylglucosamine kinase [Gimesia sp.]HCO22265.1 N-acetylglucosamine kinase [Gimesia maris]|tara:strand:- start:15601 stop:16554 length:954 start_codon:yes stop_codon:yes gene_type:complete